MGDHPMFYDIPTKLHLPTDFQGFSPSLCIYMFQKYWAWVHFKHDPHEYVVRLNYLTPNEIKIKKDLESLYEGLGYEKGLVLPR